APRASVLVAFAFVRGREALLAARPARRLGLERRDALLHAALQLVEPLAQADDLLDPGEVHAELLRQAPDLAELLDVALRVEPRLARAAARLDQPLPLVQPEGLGVHVDQLGGDADHVQRLVAVDLRLVSLLPLAFALALVVVPVLQAVPPEASLRNQPRAARTAPATRSTFRVRRRSPPPSPAPATTSSRPSFEPGGTSTVTPS